ncbi:MAG: peptidase M28 family protein, partial [Bacteroidota bacterium]
MKKLTILATLLLSSLLMKAQNTDSLFIQKLFANTLTNNQSYEQLRYLCKNIGGRIGGSPQSARARA